MPLSIARSDTNAALNARTSGTYVRAEAADIEILDGADTALRAALIARLLEQWKSLTEY